MENLETPPGTPTPQKVYTATFRGNGETFAVVLLKNFFLTVITFGIYAPWGKTNRRKYLWQNTEFDGQRLTYIGTGQELAIGYTKVFCAYLLLVTAGKLIGLLPSPIPEIIRFPTPFIVLALIGFAVYSSRAYLLRRTLYRGIQFGLDPAGRSVYVKTFFIWSFLSVLTFGILSPYLGNKLHTILTNHTRLGSEPVRYTGTDRDAFRIFIRSLPWIILTLGVYLIWYHAKILKFQAEHTTFDAARAKFTVEGGDIFVLHLVNLLLLVCTFGLALPWIIVRNMEFAVNRTSLIGDIDFSRIVARPSTGNAAGDAFAGILDADLGL